MKKLMMLIVIAGMLISAGDCAGTDSDIARWNSRNVTHKNGEKEEYFIIGSGYGGATDSTNFTVEGGWKTERSGRDTLVAIGFPIIFSGGGESYDETDEVLHSVLVGSFKESKMGDYRKNPKTPFEIWVPNKIRKRIAMHEKEGSAVWKLIRESLMPTPLRALASLKTPTPKVRGSMWSRFTNSVKKFLR